jgi:hypothetical protein
MAPMTLTMQDSINVGNLTPGADAYLGYTDGHWPTYEALRQRFGGSAHVLSMAVFPSDDAVGCDREPGDLNVTDIAGWVKRQLARGVWRPVVYASASNMGACLGALIGTGVPLDGFRLLSAHYGAGKHICGPHTCGLVNADMDGTQWTDSAPGANGSLIDESVLLDDFFGGDMPLTAADYAGIAKAVWQTAGLVPAPAGQPTAPSWTAGALLQDASSSARAARAAATVADTDARAATAAASGDPAAVAADVLKGLDAPTIATAIATSLGPDVGQEVLVALAAKLAAP